MQENYPNWLQRRGTYRVLSWALSVVAFVAGPVVGMTVHAHLGAGIWLASAMLALAPFASHRHRKPPGDGPQSDHRSGTSTTEG